MGGTLSKVFSIFLACVLMFIVPVLLANERKKNMIQSYVLTETIEFVDEVCNKGIIYEEEYIELLNNLAISGELLNINLEHYSKCEGDEGVYYAGYYNDSIIEKIKNDGSYPMKKGDSIKVKIYEKSGTILAFYGGCVKDEDY